MIPLSRVLAQLGRANEQTAEHEARPAPHTTNNNAATHDGAHVFSAWNPTGNIFDLRPDLAHTPISELAGALLEMRQLLCTHDESINRLQLMRFERQYSNALWRRATAENIDTVAVNNTYYRLLLTDGMDVVILPAS